MNKIIEEYQRKTDIKLVQGVNGKMDINKSILIDHLEDFILIAELNNINHILINWIVDTIEDYEEIYNPINNFIIGNCKGANYKKFKSDFNTINDELSKKVNLDQPVYITFNFTLDNNIYIHIVENEDMTSSKYKESCELLFAEHLNIKEAYEEYKYNLENAHKLEEIDEKKLRRDNIKNEVKSIVENVAGMEDFQFATNKQMRMSLAIEYIKENEDLYPLSYELAQNGYYSHIGSLQIDLDSRFNKLKMEIKKQKLLEKE